MSTIVATIRSLAAYLAVSLYVAVTAPIGMGLAGIRTRVAGRNNLPVNQAVVFCANHQSNVDPPILFNVLHPRLHVLFKAELKKLPLLGKAFQVGGFVPIERTNRERSMAAIEQAAQSLREGNSFLTFPEGTRTPTGG